MAGALFSAYFLDEGVALQPDWTIDDGALAQARVTIAELLNDFETRAAPNEANTESDLVEPLLRLLGWGEWSKQEKIGPTGRADVPDYLLFREAAAKQAAVRADHDRYRHGAAIVEGKRWRFALDNATRQEAAPSTQMLRYLGAVDAQSDGSIRFGILTNGQIWRLYDHRARSRLEGFVEIDLAYAAGLVVPAEGPAPGYADRLLRQFLYLFGRAAFAPDAAGRTRLERAIEASRGFEARVTDALAKTVFEDVFPDLADALARADPARGDGPAYFAELREAALTWLYRLLFTLYAEDRDLLPTRTRRDGLRAMRESVAAARDGGERFSAHPEHDRDLRSLWRKIDGGDAGIGLPPYNGGLFRAGRSPLLDRSLIPDGVFAPLLDAMSRERTGKRPRLINYRDLNVQHLGSVYERLLEFDVVSDGARIVARPQTFARKTSGSYYTPEELVLLVIRRTVGPLLDDRRAAFAAAVADKARRDQDPAYRLPWLQTFDPAAKFLELRIVDPAMGSGHFLVSLVDYLADQVMAATEASSALVDDAGSYRSPLLDRLESIRARIVEQARANDWKIDENQLIDRQLVRRIILKRVIHGVDKNPMAVELAKLSLWLHTFTVGAPLSFLDHHLRCGDSLFGEWVIPGMARLERGGLYKRPELDLAARAIGEIAHVEDLTDADIAEVHESADSFAEARAHIAPLERYFDLLQGYRWIEGSAEDALKQAKALQKQADRSTDVDESFRLTRQAWDLKRRGRALDVLLDGELGPPDAVLDQCYGRVGDTSPPPEGDDPALAPLVRAATIARVSNFLHWELAFPTVWQNWLSPERRSGGFDAVIGNPPWDRLKLQQVEWFAARAPAIARATRAADRARMIRELTDTNQELRHQFVRASEMAALASRMANLKSERGGEYPLLGHGDVNLYSLFVERAGRLVKPDGLVGLLTPSGIAGDLGAAAFFRSVSTTGRLHTLLDYENRGVFFPDVHRSFKFSVIVFGGVARKAAAANAGFFLTETGDDALTAQTFPLTPADFTAVNPNTGTAPVFRNKRDAELTAAIYRRLPVLVRHAANAATQESQQWPVRYATMFHMTNDSHLFRTAAELTIDGWYPVAGGRWKRGDDEAVPLYVGRMFWQFDHRASSVTVNEDNLHNSANSDRVSVAEKANPMFAPTPQYYVQWNAVAPQRDWTLAFRDITNTTNERTIVSAILPGGAYGNTAALIINDEAIQNTLLMANLNSFALDYIARQKLQGTHANWYIVEQLPVIPPAGYDRSFGDMTAREIVAREVLHLTYTAHDLAAFARDMGHIDATGAVLPPFVWDEADRRQRRARLDALYFHLHGLDRDEADYVLSTFPIVAKNDQRDFGRYLTRDLILAQMAALAAGDPNAVIAIR